MRSSPTTMLAQLERLKLAYDATSAATKLQLLQGLQGTKLAKAKDVLRLHELLCFLRAYPDSATLLAQVETMLGSFSSRTDLRPHRAELADTGVAGARIYYRFFWPMARWLARRWPDRLFLEWADIENDEKLLELLPLLVPYSERGAFEELDLSPREWLARLKGPEETDASFLVRRIEASFATTSQREAQHDGLDLWYRFEPGPDTPARTHAKIPRQDIVYQTKPLDRSRPSLQQELKRRPLAVRTLSPREGQKFVDLARAAMLTRSRDLDVFGFGDRNDVRLVDFGEGLQFACIGFLPERRSLLHAIYGFLTLKNGVPIGYVLASALYRAAEIAYNTFETYRGAEAAVVFSRVLAMAHYLFGAESFSIDPYQLGSGNMEGLKSGAWWFYYKLGFRPLDPDVRTVLRGELARMKKNPAHRSNITTLRKLASEHVFFDPDPTRKATGLLPLESISLAISDYLAAHFGVEREKGTRTCSRQAASRLGVRSLSHFSPPERQAWERWSPLLMAIDGIDRWSTAEKRALVQVVRAKGGRHESDFVHLFDQHRKLQRAVLKLAERAEA